jgi:hypothetical protein
MREYFIIYLRLEEQGTILISCEIFHSHEFLHGISYGQCVNGVFVLLLYIFLIFSTKFPGIKHNIIAFLVSLFKVEVYNDYIL